MIFLKKLAVIGFNAYSKEKGQYGVRNVKITALPIAESMEEE